MTDKIFIPISTKTLANEAVQTADARRLHAFLDVKTPFKQWLDGRIADYDFVENQDFVIFAENSAKTFWGRGRPTTDYALTLDMAKELCMVERNEKGRQARRYFIAAEKKLQALAAFPAWAGDMPHLPELLADCGLSRTAGQRLVKQLSMDAVQKRPLRARVVLAVQNGLSWQDLREAGTSKRKDLLKAVEDCLKLGLITSAPEGTPGEYVQAVLALTEVAEG